MIILIDGYLATGKSILRGLLDGYPGLFLSPVQDGLIGGFAQQANIDECLKERDVIGLAKEILPRSNYYWLAHYAWKKNVKFHASVDDIATFDLNFDFESYHYDCMKQIHQLSEWTVEELLNIFYGNMKYYWDNNIYTRNPINAYVTWDMPALQIPLFFLNYVTHGKILSIQRPIEDIVATRVKRKPVADNYRSKYRNTFTLSRVLSTGEINQIQHRQQIMEQQAKSYPDKILLISFDDMIEKTEMVMRDVATFLGIEYVPGLSSFSFNGIEPKFSSGTKFVGEVCDKAETLLSKNDKMLLNAVLNKQTYCHVLFRNPKVGLAALRLYVKKTMRRFVGKLIKILEKLAVRLSC